MGFTVQGEDQGQGMFCHRFGGIGRNPNYPDPGFFRRYQIHVIKTCTSKGNGQNSQIFQDIYGLPVHHIIDKYTYRFVPCGQVGSSGTKTGFKMGNLMPKVLTCHFKVFCVVGL